MFVSNHFSIINVVNSIYASNTYILTSKTDPRVYLIDIGDFDKVVSKIPLNAEISGVFLTHTHYDHIYGILELLKSYPACKVYTSKYGKIALGSSKLNLSKYHNTVIEVDSNNVIELYNDIEMDLFDKVCIKVLETPGHDKSCLSYVIGNNIFSGDSYIPDIKVVTCLPSSDKKEAEVSVQKIKAVAKGANLFPGHGPSFFEFDPNKVSI